MAQEEAARLVEEQAVKGASVVSIFGLILGLGVLSCTAVGQSEQPLKHGGVGRARFEKMIELRDQQDWVLNPKPAPFPHTIGPGVETVAGRLMWHGERLRGNSASIGTMLETELSSLRSLESESYPTERVLAALETEQPLIAELIEASRMRVVPIAVSGAPGSLERDLDDPLRMVSSLYRGACRLLLADAVRLWHAGERDASVERVAAAMRLALPHDGAAEPMAVLIRASIFQMSTKLALAMVEAGLGEDLREMLRDELVRFDADDPVAIRGTWVGRAQGWVAYAEMRLDNGVVEEELRYALSRQVLNAQMMRAIGTAFLENPEEPGPAADPDAATLAEYQTSMEQVQELLRDRPLDLALPGAAEWVEKAGSIGIRDRAGLVFVATQWLPILHQVWPDTQASYQSLKAALDP